MNRGVLGVAIGAGISVLTLIGVTFAMRDTGRWRQSYVKVQELPPVSSTELISSSTTRQNHLYGGASLPLYERSSSAQKSKAGAATTLSEKKRVTRKQTHKSRLQKATMKKAQSLPVVTYSHLTSSDANVTNDPKPDEGNSEAIRAETAPNVGEDGNSGREVKEDSDRAPVSTSKVILSRSKETEAGTVSTWERIGNSRDDRRSRDTWERIDSPILGRSKRSRHRLRSHEIERKQREDSARADRDNSGEDTSSEDSSNASDR